MLKAFAKGLIVDRRSFKGFDSGWMITGRLDILKFRENDF